MKRIAPMARRNYLTLCVAGAMGGLFSLLLLLAQAPLWSQLPLTLISIGAIVLGWLKWQEPAVSLLLNRYGLCYCHRKGYWRVSWQQIQRLDTVRYNNEALPYIGLRFRPRSQPLALSPRLALALFLEQRELCRLAAPTQNPMELLLQPPYSVLDGFRLQQRLLRARLGYDIYLPQSAFDRSITAAQQQLQGYWKNAFLLT
ncbi:MAG: DUF2982 domain-containing protein [Ferrimonas sp.]